MCILTRTERRRRGEKTRGLATAAEAAARVFDEKYVLKKNRIAAQQQFYHASKAYLCLQNTMHNIVENKKIKRVNNKKRCKPIWMSVLLFTKYMDNTNSCSTNQTTLHTIRPILVIQCEYRKFSYGKNSINLFIYLCAIEKQQKLHAF